MTDPLDRVLAKSAQRGRAPERLTAHSSATLRAALQLQKRVGRLEAAEQVMNGQYWDAVALAAVSHDAGKVAAGFQDMLAGRSRSWGERHEVLSLGFLPALVPDPELRSWVAAGVATHHRPLTGTTGRDLELLYAGALLEELADRFGPLDDRTIAAADLWLRTAATTVGLPCAAPRPHDALTSERLVAAAHQLLEQVLQRWGRRVSPEQGLSAVLLQGAVTLADHLSSAHGSLDTHQPFDATFRPKLEAGLAEQGRHLRAHQVDAAEVSGHLLLRAPTGSGKTEAVLLWAARQATELAMKTGGIPRVFFTLPYLASINAMADRLGDLLGDRHLIGIAHSRAASYHLTTAIGSPDGTDDDTHDPCHADAAAKALARAAATRLTKETTRVGTPYQLLRAALAGPAHAGLLVDAANSVFILDELHAYDPRRLGYILAAAKLWERLGGRIAVVSATLPDVLAELFSTNLASPTRLVDAPDLALPDRHRLAVRPHHLTDPQTVDEIRESLDRGQSVLVVANNVAHARDLFAELAPHARERHGDDAALLLHSRFRRMDRNRIEKRIRERFATVDAPGQHARRPGLLIATQVVEVSLDIDLDVLFTAAAPLEALLQRFGRINRTAARQPADVIVHAPTWTTRRGQAGDFADGIYPRQSVEDAWHRLVGHHGNLIDETQATAWLNAIYAGDWGQQWSAEVTDHRDSFERALLTFPAPFADRTHLTETFDELFDGTEAILDQDRDAYAQALADAGGAPGRLNADQYLIPMPHWAGPLTTYERTLNIRIIHGDYDPDLGLLAVRGRPQSAYRPGEIL
ncbi:CRISPR-associated helicase/endonuclease Cas3 [Kitasatospora nipponensis]|uniref:CRISPR-associated helicase/endonuclease Cas3 n=1 Tax=Kitasatospora nipponensis TaxID=258049 RepID=A0ABP4GZF8_9ACTN